MEYIKLTDGLTVVASEAVILPDIPICLLAFGEGECESALMGVGRDLVEHQSVAVVYSSFDAIPLPEVNGAQDLGDGFHRNRDMPKDDLLCYDKTGEVELSHKKDELSEDRSTENSRHSDVEVSNFECLLNSQSNEKRVDSDSILARVALVTIAVSEGFLRDKERACKIIRRADEYKLPILPILIEKVNLEDYNSVFGKRQYLDRMSDEEIAVGYYEKLDSYFHSMVLSSKIRKKIARSMRGTLFLSYRKVDRSAAVALMHRIHSLKGYSDLAIWYDEYITAGISFDSLLEEQIRSADGFVMAITPHLVDEGNYVAKVEYPLAKECGKPILPVLTLPTEVSAINSVFPDCPAVITDDETLLLALNGIFGEREEIIEPERKYILGLAYLYGAHVELDRERGLSLIISAAEDGYIEAILRLSKMYETGFAVDQSYFEAEGLLVDNYNKFQNEFKAGKFDRFEQIYKLLEAIAEVSQKTGNIEKYLASTHNLCVYSLLILKNQLFMDSPFTYAHALHMRFLALSKMGEPEKLCEEAKENMSWFEELDRETISDLAMCEYLKALAIISDAHYLIGNKNEGNELIERSLSVVYAMWDKEKEVTRAYELISVLERLYYSARNENLKKVAELLHTLCLYCYEERRGANTKDKLICSCLRMAEVNLPNNKEKARGYLDFCISIIDELNSDDRKKYSYRLRYAEAGYLIACEEYERGVSLFEELFEEDRATVDNNPQYLNCVFLGMRANRISNLFKYKNDEENSYVYLAHALEYTTRAVKLNPSSEAYRQLSEIYDAVGNSPFAEKKKWLGARRFNAVIHTKYTVTEEVKKSEIKKDVIPSLLLFAMALLGFVACYCVYSLNNSILEASWAKGLFIIWIVGCSFMTVHSIVELFGAWRSLRGIKNSIDEKDTPEDYTQRVRKMYRFYKNVNKFSYFIIAISLLEIILSFSCLLLNLSLTSPLPIIACIIGGIIIAWNMIYAFSKLLLDSTFATIAGFVFK